MILHNLIAILLEDHILVGIIGSNYIGKDTNGDKVSFNLECSSGIGVFILLYFVKSKVKKKESYWDKNIAPKPQLCSRELLLRVLGAVLYDIVDWKSSGMLYIEYRLLCIYTFAKYLPYLIDCKHIVNILHKLWCIGIGILLEWTGS